MNVAGLRAEQQRGDALARSAAGGSAVTLARGLVRSGQIPEWAKRLVRVGYAAKGAVYGLVGGLALALALGFAGGRLTDTSGSLRTVAAQPFGAVWLGVIGVGLVDQFLHARYAVI
jgi:hypothetical protein